MKKNNNKFAKFKAWVIEKIMQKFMKMAMPMRERGTRYDFCDENLYGGGLRSNFYCSQTHWICGWTHEAETILWNGTKIFYSFVEHYIVLGEREKWNSISFIWYNNLGVYLHPLLPSIWWSTNISYTKYVDFVDVMNCVRFYCYIFYVSFIIFAAKNMYV